VTPPFPRIVLYLIPLLMDTSVFYKYPRTPHAEGSGTIDDDDIVSCSNFYLTKLQVMSKGDWKTLSNLGKKLVVQEKVDGANVSVYFESEWHVLHS
jgi:hypothetical protein